MLLSFRLTQLAHFQRGRLMYLDGIFYSYTSLHYINLSVKKPALAYWLKRVFFLALAEFILRSQAELGFV